MHRVLESHLNSFAVDHGVVSDSQPTKFEKFCALALMQSKVAARIDLDDVTTAEDDDGIDGLAVIVNEAVVLGKEDALLAFASERKNNDVEIIFVQAKTSERYDLGDFLKFKEAILRFVSETPYAASSALQQEARAAFDVVVDNVSKVRGGKPTLSAHFATAGIYQEPAPLEAARQKAIGELKDLGYFSTVDVSFVDREGLISLWSSAYSTVEVELELHSHAGLPKIAGIEESYLAVVRAKEFVEKVLTADDGSIRSHLFEDNVRHFLGSSNTVNTSISETIRDTNTRTRFPVLNNGVTVVSPDVIVRGNRMHIKDLQIVNGCQTSHVLFDNSGTISDDMMMTLKVIETNDEDLFSQLVRATNSQSKVDESQFYSLSPMARRIENYFNTFEGQEGRLYFERRARQYAGKGVPALRIIDLDTAARAFCSMYLRRPDLAFRYPKMMYDQLADSIFDSKNRESLYYASALVIYRIHVLTSNGTLTGSVRRFKWHLLPLVAALVSDSRSIPQLNSRSADNYAQKIVDVFQSANERMNELLLEATKIIHNSGTITNDRLKRQAILDEMLSCI